MSLRKIGWLLVISICALSVNANEDGKVYRVEILVFQNLDKSQLEGESWKGNPGYPRFEKAIKLLPLTSDEIENEEDSMEQNDLALLAPEITDTVLLQNENSNLVLVAPEIKGTVILQDESTDLALLAPEIKGTVIPQDESTDLALVSPEIKETVLPQKESTEAVNTAPSYWVPYQSLSEDELYLKPFRDRLLKSEEYFPIRLIGWVQSVESREQARAVYLGDNLRDNESFNNNDLVDATPAIEETPAIEGTNPVSVPEENASLFEVKSTLFADTEPLSVLTGTEDLIEEASAMGTPLPQPNNNLDVQKEQPSVEGIVRVSKATYFHVDVDMALNLPVQDTTEEVPYYLDDNWRAVFRLFESRRVKLEQINYFDHPAFGALVYVSEIKPPEEEEVVPSDSVSLLPTK